LIFVDSNVPMYLVGREHPHKIDAQLAIERLLTDQRSLITSVEVLQEILHRYGSTNLHARIQPALDLLTAAVDQVLPVDEFDVLAAKDLVLTRTGLSARDALHVAVMQRHSIAEILTFDRGFDLAPGIRRLPG
jgi:hypothetical protein